MQKLSIEELDVVIKMLKKIEKIIKSNEFINKWYLSGHIRVNGKSNGIALLPIVEVFRLIPEQFGDLKSVNMDKVTKDKITIFLKKNDCIYYESFEGYIYGGNILKKIKQNGIKSKTMG
jgi:hypothetical protein